MLRNDDLIENTSTYSVRGGEIEYQSGDIGNMDNKKWYEIIAANPWYTVFFTLLGISAILMVCALCTI